MPASQKKRIFSLRFWYNAESRDSCTNTKILPSTFHLNATPSLKATPRLEKSKKESADKGSYYHSLVPLNTPPPPTRSSSMVLLIVPRPRNRPSERTREFWGPSRLFTLHFSDFWLYCFHKNQDDLEQHLKSYFSHSEALVFPAMVKVEGSYIFLKAASTRHEHLQRVEC